MRRSTRLRIARRDRAFDPSRERVRRRRCGRRERAEGSERGLRRVESRTGRDRRRGASGTPSSSGSRTRSCSIVRDPRAIVVFSGSSRSSPNTVAYVDALWLRGETFYAQKEYPPPGATIGRSSTRRTTRGSSRTGRARALSWASASRINDLQGLDGSSRSSTPCRRRRWTRGSTTRRARAYYFRRATTRRPRRARPGAGEHAVHARLATSAAWSRSNRPRPRPPPRRPDQPGTRRRAASPTNSQIGHRVLQGRDRPRPPTRKSTGTSSTSPGWPSAGSSTRWRTLHPGGGGLLEVGRSSPEFGTMLYELAWVYVRLGDVQRAERALEVLSIADPSSTRAGDATLLARTPPAASLRLRLCLGVREEYEPIAKLGTSSYAPGSRSITKLSATARRARWERAAPADRRASGRAGGGQRDRFAVIGGRQRANSSFARATSSSTNSASSPTPRTASTRSPS